MPAAPAFNAYFFHPLPLAPLVPTPLGVISRRRPAGSDSSDATPPKRPIPIVNAGKLNIPFLMSQQFGADIVGEPYCGYYTQTKMHNYNYSVGASTQPPPGFGYNFDQYILN